MNGLIHSCSPPPACCYCRTSGPLRDEKKSRVHLATQTLVLTIELPVWNWWQTADGQKLESETNQEVNEEKNYSSSPLPPLLRRKERERGREMVEGEGWREHEGGKSRSQRILGNTGRRLLFMLSWLFWVNLNGTVHFEGIEFVLNMSTCSGYRLTVLIVRHL